MIAVVTDFVSSDFVFRRRKGFGFFEQQCPRFAAEQPCGVLGLSVHFSGPHIIIYQGGVERCHIRMLLFDTHFAPTSVATQGVGQCIMRAHMSV